MAVSGVRSSWREVGQELALELLRAAQRGRLGLGRARPPRARRRGGASGRRRRAGRGCRCRCRWAPPTRRPARAGPAGARSARPPRRSPIEPGPVEPGRAVEHDAAAADQVGGGLGRRPAPSPGRSPPAPPAAPAVAGRLEQGDGVGGRARRTARRAPAPCPPCAASGPVRVSSIPRMRLEDAVAPGDLAEQPLPLDRRRGQVRVERHQLERPRAAASRPRRRRPRSRRARRRRPGSASPTPTAPRPSAAASRRPAHAGWSCDVARSPPRPAARRARPTSPPLGAERAAPGCAASSGSRHADRGPAAQHRRLVGARPVVEQVHAHLVGAERGRQRRDDQRDRRRRLLLGQLVDEAVQPLDLAAGAGVGLDAGHQGDDVVGVQLDAWPGRPTTRPWRSTTIRSARPKTCSMRCEMSRTPQPDARSSRTMPLDHVGLGHAERGGGLVEHEQPRPAEQGPGDGERLALAARELADRPAQVVDVRRRARRAAPAAATCMSASDEPRAAAQLPPEEQVGDGVEVLAQGEVLPHHADVGRGRRRGAPRRRRGRARRRRTAPASTCRRRSRRPARPARRRAPTRSTPSSTTWRPKRFVRPRTSSSGSAARIAGEAHHRPGRYRSAATAARMHAARRPPGSGS